MTETRKHFVFDAYGTLFDVHSPARALAPLIGEGWPRLSAVWRYKQLEYTWINAALGRHMPFREATRQGLVYALKFCGHDEALAPKILEGYARLETFPDVAPTLHALKARGARLAILSNGDPDMLDELVENASLRAVFDAVISVAAAGTFKPAPQVYALCTERFAVAPAAITFMSSNRWDIAGATAFGFESIWVNRFASPDEYPELAPRRVFTTLEMLLA